MVLIPFKGLNKVLEMTYLQDLLYMTFQNTHMSHHAKHVITVSLN